MSLLLLLRPHESGAGPGPAPDVAQTPAGRAKKRRKYVVEVDGQEFTVESAQQAQALLDRATSLAHKAAEATATKLVEDATPKAIRLGKVKPVTLKPPVLTGPDEFSTELTLARERIKRIYLDAAIVAELRILMAFEAERDDEEAILLSL